MAKVLIATLGTGRIKDGQKEASKRANEPATYRLDETGKEYNTPFIVEALAEELDLDKIILVGTGKSMWEEVYRYFTEKSGKEVDLNYWIALGEKVTSTVEADLITNDELIKINEALDNYLKHLNSKASGGSQCMTVKYGLDAKELWENFEIFMGMKELLEEGDEVYVDITHAFRSIPIFMYLMLDFIDTLQSNKSPSKRIQLSGIYYGMLEVSTEKGYAPIVDLAPMFSISKWIRATHSFVNYGNGQLMAQLIKNTELKKTITSISEQISINYLVELRSEIDKLRKKIEELEKTPIEDTVFTYMIPTLKDFVDRFKRINSDSAFQLAMAKWYFDNNNYSNGYICMAEAILTRLCEIYNLSITKLEERNIIKPLLWENNMEDRNEELKELVEIYSKKLRFDRGINAIRNKIAHASFDGYVREQDKKEKPAHKQDIKNANYYYNEIYRILNSNGIKELPKVISIEEIKKVSNKSSFCKV